LSSCALLATLACAPAVYAQQQPSQAQTAPAKPVKKPVAKPKPADSAKAKPTESAKPDATKPAAAKSAVPAIGGATPHLLGQYGEWGSYSAVTGGKKICFALAKPSKTATTPPNRPRDPPYMFISSRPSEKVRDEVSIIAGYGFKTSAEASIDVGGSVYTMS